MDIVLLLIAAVGTVIGALVLTGRLRRLHPRSWADPRLFGAFTAVVSVNVAVSADPLDLWDPSPVLANAGSAVFITLVVGIAAMEYRARRRSSGSTDSR